MAARSLTSVYDEHLQPSGLRSTQLAVLWAVIAIGGETVGRLAKLIAMDNSTLTRTLKVLERDKLIALRVGADRRQKQVQATLSGPKSLLLSDAAVGKSAGGCDSQAEGQKSARCQLVIAKSFKRAAALIFFDQMPVYTDINHAAVGPYRDFDL